MTALSHHHRRAEILNIITHGAGLVASVLGAIMLVGMAMSSRNPLEVPSVAVYCTSLVLVYLSSTLYHSAENPRTKSRLQVFDHCAIYLLIAGTYTPLLLLGIGGETGWTYFTAIWAMAAAGIVFKYFFTGRMTFLSVMTYLAMGWVAVLVGQPLLAALPSETVILILLGGIAYTVGAFVFMSHRPYAHSLWHLFVIAGSACHFFAIVARVNLL